MVKFDKYVKGNKNNITVYTFPADNVSPEEKLTPEWCMQFAQAIYYLYSNNLCSVNYGSLTQFQRLRAYGNGSQSQNIYMDILDPKEQVTTGSGQPNDQQPGATTSFQRKGYMNINWNILQIAPKFKNYVLGVAEEIDHDVFADGVDEKSSQVRQMEKWRLWTEMKFGRQLQEMAASAGVQMERPDYVPETMQELEMYSQMGGFRLKSEIAIEAAINYTLDISLYKELKRKCITDLFELGMCGTKDYVDPDTQKVMVRYVNPARGVFPYSYENDFKKMPFAGEFVTYTIADLRSMNKPDGSGPLFTDEELYNIAQQYVGLLGNPMATLAPYQYQQNYILYEWNRFNVTVLDCEYISDDYKYTTTITNPDGTKEVKATKFGKVRNSDTKKTAKTKTKMVYKCKWIVGTDFCWDYGHQFDIPRPTPSECRVSFHFVKTEGPSMTQMMIGPLDQFQLAYLRLQNAIATGAPNGLAIDVGSLSNVNIGGSQGKMSPLQLIKLRNQTGTLLYSATTHRSYMPTQNNYKPIQELAGGAGQQINDCIQLMDHALQLIQDITGINRIASAQNPTGEDLVGVSQIALQSTATVLKPLFSQYLSMKQRMAMNVALRIQLLVKDKRYAEGYNIALGNFIVKTLDLGSEVNNAMFNIIIRVRPSAEEKAKINEAATISMQAGRNGMPGISMGDYLTINRFIGMGMLKYAEAYLAYRESVAKKEAAEQAATNSKQQQDAMLALEKQKEQTLMTDYKMQTDKELALIEAKKNAEMQVNSQKHDFTMQELQVKVGGQVQMNKDSVNAKMMDTLVNNKTKNEIADKNMAVESAYIDVEHRKIDEQPKEKVVKSK